MKNNIVVFVFVLLLAFAFADVDYSAYKDLSQEEIDALMLEYNISQENIDSYMTENVNSIEDFDFSQLTCEMIKQFGGDDVVGSEIPEQIPFKNEIVSLYLDEKFVGSIVIEDSYIKDYSCEDNLKSTYNVFVTKETIIDITKLDTSNISSIIDFYKEKKASGDLKIKGVGFGKSFKFFFLNIGISVASWFI